MKKSILILAIAVVGTGIATAHPISSNSFGLYVQQGPQGTPQERAEQLTKRMNELLNLTADQNTKIQEINVRRFTEQQALREKMRANGGDRETMMQSFRALTEKYNAEYKNVLTTEQYAKYEANQDQFRGGRGGQGSSRPQGR